MVFVFFFTLFTSRLKLHCSYFTVAARLPRTCLGHNCGNVHHRCLRGGRRCALQPLWRPWLLQHAGFLWRTDPLPRRLSHGQWYTPQRPRVAQRAQRPPQCQLAPQRALRGEHTCGTGAGTDPTGQHDAADRGHEDVRAVASTGHPAEY